MQGDAAYDYTRSGALMDDPGSPWLRRWEAAARLRLSTKQFDRLRDEPGFPKPHMAGPQTPLWLKDEIDEFMRQRPGPSSPVELALFPKRRTPRRRQP